MEKNLAVYLNGKPTYWKLTPSAIIGCILCCLSGKIQYMSSEAIVDTFRGAMEIASQQKSITGKGDALLTKQIRNLHTKLEQEVPRDTLIAMAYDYILRAEKMGTLPGFGYISFETKEKGKRKLRDFFIDPEKISIYKV